MKRIKNGLIGFFLSTDIIFWLLTFCSTAYGFILVYSMSRAGSGIGVGFFATQIIAVLIGYMAAVILATRDYVLISKFWLYIAGFSVLILVYTLIFGWGPAGVDDKAWISLGPANFQPAELVKILFMITFSKHVAILEKNGKIETFAGVISLALHLAVPVALVHMQGDDGTALVFVFMFLFMTFGCRVQLRYYLMTIIALSVSVPILWNSFFNDDQKSRFLAVFDLDSSVLGSGWQQYQGKISIASGELFGRGLFHGPRVDSGVVPYQESDFIFTVAGEELGFIGCLFLVLLLFLLCVRSLRIGMLSKDTLGKSICFGFFGMVFAQAIMNIAMCLGIIPVIGITLPFFSSGGSSVMCLYFGVGLVQSVYVFRKDDKKVKLRINKPVKVY